MAKDSGVVTIKIGKQETLIKDANLSGAIKDFCVYKEQESDYKARCEELKEIIADKARTHLGDNEASTITFLIDDSGAKVSFSWDLKVIDEEGLKNLLGDSFSILVKEKKELKPQIQLKEMALNNKKIDKCLSITEKKPSVSIA